MIFLDCPACGSRASTEFAYWGEVHAREEVDATSLQAWRRVLYLRENPAGWARERWLHVAGCGRFIEVERHRTTNEVRHAATAGGGLP